MSEQQNKQSKPSGQRVLKVGDQLIPLGNAIDTDPALLEALTNKESTPPAAGFPMEFFQVISPGVNPRKGEIQTATFPDLELAEMFLDGLPYKYEIYRVLVEDMEQLMDLMDRRWTVKMKKRMELIKEIK